MIYKFADYESAIDMEVNHIENTNPEPDSILFTIKTDEEALELNIHLNKKEVFKLIGALHLLHKEMK